MRYLILIALLITIFCPIAIGQILFEENWDDGNWTSNPTWREYDNFGNFAIADSFGYVANPCLEGWSGNIGTDYTALYTLVNVGAVFSANFWVHKRTPKFSIIKIGFCKGEYNEDNRGFFICINHNNMTSNWELIIYEVDGTILFNQVIQYDNHRWTNIRMTRGPYGDWEVIWDYLGSYQLVATVHSVFVPFPNNTFLWLGPAGYYGITGGFYIDDINITEYQIIVTLFPHNLPIQIPANGGSFVFDVNIENTNPFPVCLDAWTEAIQPGGHIFSPLILNTHLFISPGAVISKYDITQFVPENAPAGFYTHICNAGNYPGFVIDDDSFSFVKLETIETENHDLGWSIYGWSDEEYIQSSIDSRGFCLKEAYPNPFNAKTAIIYQLQAASYVELVVYDINGREVARLVDGYRSAGVYETVFDGSQLSSGIYFVSLKCKGFSQTQKLILIK